MSNTSDPTLHPNVRDFTGTTTKLVIAIVGVLLAFALFFVLLKGGDSEDTSGDGDRAPSLVVVPTSDVKSKFDETVGRALSPDGGLSRKPVKASDIQEQLKTRFETVKEGRPDFFNLPNQDLTKAKIYNDFELAEYRRALESQVTGMLQGGNLSSSGAPRSQPSFSPQGTESQRLPSTPPPSDLESRLQSLKEAHASAVGSSGLTVQPNLPTQPNRLSAAESFGSADLAASNSTFPKAQPEGSMTVPAGTLIPVKLISPASSDNPGIVLTKVTRDIYDRTGRFVLIPAYSDAIATAVRLESNSNAVINNRIGVVPSRIIRPDGLQIPLIDASLSDPDGTPNLKGQVNSHLFPRALATVGYFAANLGFLKFVFDETENRNPGVTVVNNGSADAGSDTVVVNDSGVAGRRESFTEIVIDEIAPQLEETIERIFRPWMDLQKTISVDSSTEASLILTADLYVTPYRDSYETFIH